MLAQLRQYSLALAIFGAAVAARLLLDTVAPGRLPYITFFPAVIVAAYFLGRGPGLFVLVLTAAVGTAWADPTGQSALAFYIASALLFLGVAGLIVFLIDRLNAANEQLRQHEAQLVMINRELKHRIKNLFAIADSVCQQTITAGGSAKDMTRAVSGRILAIASAQDLLSVTATQGANLRDLVEKLVSTLAPQPSRLDVSGEHVVLPAEITTNFALVLHELATNALKYGAWSKDEGRVKVSWRVENSRFNFRWREHDGPVPAPPIREGLGHNLIRRSLEGARVEHSLRPDGLECEIEIALKAS
jgi:two-component sensor histidine kinase